MGCAELRRSFEVQRMNVVTVKVCLHMLRAARA